jgi:[NiFe] hydrogenase assembly HybE family chaperone
VSAALADRVAALEAAFRHIAKTRLAGLGLLQPRLRVQAVGFAPGADDPRLALGVLVTPWFMNLLRLPLCTEATTTLPAPGAKQRLTLGGQALDFIGAQEDQIGRYAACSLFSPMADFADQHAAVATAQAVLQLLRPAPVTSTPTPTPRPTPTPAPTPSAAAPVAATAVPSLRAQASVSSMASARAPSVAPAPARRGFLFGRSAGGAR